jgi:DNA-binding MarR family transcriptional regulator
MAQTAEGEQDQRPDDELVTWAEAREILGVSKQRMTDFVKTKEEGGLLEIYKKGVDRRIKWLRLGDVRALKVELNEARRA